MNRSNINRNYQSELDAIISNIKTNHQRKRLMLHCCCAPCSSYVLEYLAPYFDITCFFYNPNIYPLEEYNLRLSEQRRLIKELNLNSKVELIVGDYDTALFEKSVLGLEACPEGSNRCETCFRLRINKTAKLANELSCTYFATTLTVSPHKNASLINAIGEEFGDKYSVKYLVSDFKKRNGYKRSIEICKDFSIYRQQYCGCKYSLPKE